MHLEMRKPFHPLFVVMATMIDIPNHTSLKKRSRDTVRRRAKGHHLSDPAWQNHHIYADDFFEHTSWQYLEMREHDEAAPFQSDPLFIDKTDTDFMINYEEMLQEYAAFNGRSLHHSLLHLMAVIQSGEVEALRYAFEAVNLYHAGKNNPWEDVFRARWQDNLIRSYLCPPWYRDPWEIFSARFLGPNPPVAWLSMMRKEKETYLRLRGKWALLYGRPRHAERSFRASKQFEQHDGSIDDEDFGIDALIQHAIELQPLYPDEAKEEEEEQH